MRRLQNLSTVSSHGILQTKKDNFIESRHLKLITLGVFVIKKLQPALADWSLVGIREIYFRFCFPALRFLLLLEIAELAVGVTSLIGFVAVLSGFGGFSANSSATFFFM